MKKIFLIFLLGHAPHSYSLEDGPSLGEKLDFKNCTFSYSITARIDSKMPQFSKILAKINDIDLEAEELGDKITPIAHHYLKGKKEEAINELHLLAKEIEVQREKQVKFLIKDADNYRFYYRIYQDNESIEAIKKYERCLESYKRAIDETTRSIYKNINYHFSSDDFESDHFFIGK